MMFWWVMLITSTLAGVWYLGYLSHRGLYRPKTVDLNRDCLVGLNYLLNEESDKAVDIFIRMLEVDSETVETHLAVGKLFRRRGEVDRAIRIHQNLIARPQLDRVYREQSLYELGQDYFSAGVLDRAEQIFLDVVSVRQYAVPALKALLDIYEREKDWQNAIITSKKLSAATKQNMHPVTAQYYCELAEAVLQQGKDKEAVTYLEQAIQEDASCARASLLRARLAMRDGDYKFALKQLKKITGQNPDYFSEAVTALAACYENLGQEDEMVQYFMKILEEYPHVPVVLILSDRIQKQRGDRIAAKYVADYVRRYPSLRGLHHFISLYMSCAEGRAKDDLVILQNLTRKLLADKPDYRCVSCGFSGSHLHWQCPGCRQWSMMRPLHCLETA